MKDIVSEDLYKNPKRFFYSYIKSRKQEFSGITKKIEMDTYTATHQ